MSTPSDFTLFADAAFAAFDVLSLFSPPRFHDAPFFRCLCFDAVFYAMRLPDFRFSPLFYAFARFLRSEAGCGCRENAFRCLVFSFLFDRAFYAR